jgi:hypothetical protein
MKSLRNRQREQKNQVTKKAAELSLGSLFDFQTIGLGEPKQ